MTRKKACFGICGRVTLYKEKMNVLLRELDRTKFITRIFKGVSDDEYYVTLDMRIEDIMQEMIEENKY